MPGLIFELVRDARGSVVHVRHRQNGECIGCIEAGLFEIVAALVVEGQAATAGVMREDTDRRCRSECTPTRARQVL